MSAALWWDSSPLIGRVCNFIKPALHCWNLQSCNALHRTSLPCARKTASPRSPTWLSPRCDGRVYRFNTIPNWLTPATHRQLVSPPCQKEGKKAADWEETMSVQKEDYRTNRADYLIAATHGRATAGDGEELLARRMKSLWLRDHRRSARLVANPSESLPAPKSRPRG